MSSLTTFARAVLAVAVLATPAMAQEPEQPPPNPPKPEEPPPPPPKQDPPTTPVQPTQPVQPVTPTAPAAPEPKKPESTATVVKGKTEVTFYGFVQFYGIYDSTQSFNEQMANGAIARPGTYAGDHGQTQMSMRHSRLGLKLSQPVANDIKATGQMEMDFLGNQPANPPGITESAFFQNGTFRFRHMYAKLETPWADVVVGQWWSLLGWQSYFHPNSVEIMGLPGQAYKRTPQVRIAKTFKSPALDIDLAIAAQRPPERQSQTPDGVAGVKATFNKLKGWRTRGANDSGLDAAAVGVSVIGRKFKADEFSASPKAEVDTNGYGISVDALLPIIPATKESHANALTLTGSFVSGAGIADQYDGLTFGVANPALPNPMMANPAPTYTANIDPGLAMFRQNDAGEFELHPVHLMSYMVGLQYYLPPKGHAWISANFTHIESDNAHAFGSKAWDKGTYFDVSLFADITPTVRVGALYSRNQQTFATPDMNGETDAHNNRVSFTMLYLF